MTPNFPKELLQRYLNGNCTAAEKLLVDSWYAQLEATGECEWEPGEKEKLEQYLTQRLLSNIPPISSLPTQAPVRRMRVLPIIWWAAAAVVLITITATWLFIDNKSDIRKSDISHTADIAAGHSGAILTLSDGRQLLLDSMGNGTIAQQNGAAVVLKDGELAYNAGATAGEMAWNTMQTPKGRQFALLLPDGTKVWLNAASSITYPVAFGGAERIVKVSGEAYFEVAANTKMPFLVQVNNKATVEVLGTHFNVNAYENEQSITTTLLEGAVRVNAGAQEHATTSGTLLRPGQQARMATATSAGNPIQIVTIADMDQVVAWKNGVFNFEGASLKEMMRQVERWYDITVVFEKGVPDIHFAGKINRNVSLNGILKALDESGIHYRMDQQRRLVLLP